MAYGLKASSCDPLKEVCRKKQRNIHIYNESKQTSQLLDAFVILSGVSGLCLWGMGCVGVIYNNILICVCFSRFLCFVCEISNSRLLKFS